MTEAAERRGLCLVLTAPSGAGKTTLTRALLARETELSLSVSVTTRAPRPGEREGIDYYYRDRAAFAELAASGALLECAEVYGQRYGTPRAAVEAALAAGRDMAFDIDWQGWRQLRRALPEDTVGVFLLPPSRQALRDRLIRRAGDSAAEIERRLAAAAADLAHWPEFDHVVINDDLTRCLDEVQAILHAARTVTRRRTGLARFVPTLG